jgi:hypothetical protein
MDQLAWAEGKGPEGFNLTSATTLVSIFGLKDGLITGPAFKCLTVSSRTPSYCRWLWLLVTGILSVVRCLKLRLTSDFDKELEASSRYMPLGPSCKNPAPCHSRVAGIPSLTALASEEDARGFRKEEHHRRPRRFILEFSLDAKMILGQTSCTFGQRKYSSIAQWFVLELLPYLFVEQYFVKFLSQEFSSFSLNV